MITEPTVFILGAGASVPYGYPTNKQLRSYICNQNFINDYHHNYIANHDSEASKRREVLNSKEFVNAFAQSGNYSIDLWLARNPRFNDIGKRAIILGLLKFESSSKFDEDMADKNKEKDWYEYLFDRMSSTLIEPDSYKKFNENKIGFITFNYDRSLEYYLQKNLSHSFTTIPQNSDFLQFISFPIYHVYGVISKLPWQNRKGDEYRPQINSKRIEIFKNNIRVIHERKSNEIDDIKALISGAKRIFFLGFGYAEENLNALDIPKTLNPGITIYGTALGSTEKERKKIINKFAADPRFKNVFVDGGMANIKRDMDCLSLLRECL